MDTVVLNLDPIVHLTDEQFYQTQVEIYRLGQPVEVIQTPALFSGEEVLPGFELQL